MTGIVSAAGFAVLLLGTSCRCVDGPPPHRNPTKPPPPDLPKATMPMKIPDFDGPQTKAFSVPYGSSRRDSHVLVVRSKYASISRHVIEYCQPSLIPQRLAPFFLAVSPNGLHLALGWRDGTDLFNVKGCGARADVGDVTTWDDLVFIQGTAATWDWKPTGERLEGRIAATRRIDDTRFVVVAPYQLPPTPEGRVPAPALGVQGGRRGARDWDWDYVYEGRRGVAAIGADFTVVVALDDHRLQVLSLVPHPQKRPTLVAERDVGVAARWLSLVGPHIMLVAPDGSGSRLQVLRGDAAPVYSVSVPFEVMQPAIDGANGRTLLAGKGLASIKDGAITWQRESSDLVHVSSFEDGSLAVATGKRLDFVKPDGTVDQSFNTEEPLVAPPAITADGSVWVASAEALYVVR